MVGTVVVVARRQRPRRRQLRGQPPRRRLRRDQRSTQPLRRGQPPRQPLRRGHPDANTQAPHPHANTDTCSATAVVADFNGDGHPDWVARNINTRQTVLVYLNDNVVLSEPLSVQL